MEEKEIKQVTVELMKIMPEMEILGKSDEKIEEEYLERFSRLFDLLNMRYNEKNYKYKYQRLIAMLRNRLEKTCREMIDFEYVQDTKSNEYKNLKSIKEFLENFLKEVN